MKFIPIVNHSLKYNPALDGLRGLAITLVILFHIWPEYFSFGYIGVDIFFVLSGFLITQIIITKLHKNNFSFKEFYRNRVRRIFPTMLIVVVFTLIIGYLLLLPNELSNLGRHAKSSLLFFQNFRLIDEVGYWDKAAELKPFLHFWSLSVEEQFYLLWPFILFALYKIRSNIFITLSIIVGLFVISSFFVEEQFYHSLARFWELAFGGLVYLISTKMDLEKISRTKYQLMIFSLFIISIIISIGNVEYSFFKTALVVVSTGLLLLVLVQSSQHKLLSSNILVFLGLISFPLYLWHYIFISYVHILNLDMSDYAVAIIFISILFSFLTYRYVEIYARKQSSFKFMYKLLATMIFIGLMGQFFYAKKGLPNRSHLEQKELFIQQFKKIEHKNALGVSLINKLMGMTPPNDYIRATSDSLEKEYILIVGDSHAHTSYPGFAQEFSKRGYETLILANSGCGPYIERLEDNTVKKSCKEKTRNIYNLLDQLDTVENIKKVLFITRAQNLSYIENLFNFFDKKDQELYFVLENPPLDFAPDVCIERPFGLSVTKEKCGVTYDKYMDKHSVYRSFVIKISKKYQNIKILDPKNVYCDVEFCYGIRENIVLYSDTHHHSVNGSIVQAQYLINKIELDE